MSDEKKKSSSRTGCLFAALGLVFFAGVGSVAFVWMVLRGVTGTTPTVERGSYLEVSLGGFFTEGPLEVDFGPLFGIDSRSIWDLRRALAAAAADPDIVGVRLVPTGTFLGWATSEEVLAHLDRFRESGKPVHAELRGDMISDAEYFLATGADQIWTTPEAASIVNGVVAEAQFYRGSLDKLHIEPQVIMYKEYKSAGEAFANYEMSDYMRESMTTLLSTIHGTFVERVSSRRGIAVEEIEAFLEKGMSPVTEMLDIGLVDRLAYDDEIRAALAALQGEDDYRGISVRRYLASRGPDRGGRKIAVVFGEGPIVTSAPDGVYPLLGGSVFSGRKVAANIRQAANDSSVDAIVFRVNSPGGAVVGSDLVRREIEAARDKGIPVVASMSDVAGSGGYWVSMAADAIVAQPTTMTGSIGVVFQKLNLDGLFEWLGTNTERLTTSSAADMFSTGSLDEKELEGVRGWMDAAYESFTAKAAAARGMDVEELEKLARGRVWSGAAAKELNLIDELGGFDEAVSLARGFADIEDDEDVRLVVVPKAKTLFEQLMNEGGLSARVDLLRAAVRPRLPSASEVGRWLDDVTTPRVQARMPEVELR